MIKYILLSFLITSSAFAERSISLVDLNTLIDKEIKCLADNIYFEARNESTQGQLAVALVTINRVKSNRYPNSVCAVVWQKNYSKRYNKWVAHFSWTLDGLSDNPINNKAYLKAEKMAEFLIISRIKGTYIADFTEGATHYHADYVTPYWSKSNKLLKLASIDTHIFYRYKK